ncbi:MAG: RagB/SusD family nutrient uptake outer membrane protein [Runella slithyformis]|nr:MAG: RagB/SusD family nutrient uptake outer membrane protein [Runella slithyformis]TAF82173.1 MAG: RagB/SusD family nutrient uptake outer membrane protein [Runella slithyformis]
MFKKMKKIIYLFVLVLFSTTACNEIIEPKLSDTGQVGVAEFYTDFLGAFQGINGVYTSLRGVYSRHWITDALSDDGQISAGGDQQFADLEFQTVQSNSSIAASLWSLNYVGIYRANVFLERAPKIAGLQGNQAILQDQFMGEAYFLRALFYHNLVRLFGDVPLITKEITDTRSLNVPRNSVQEVQAQIEKDLLEAIRILPERHPNPKLIQPVVNIPGGREVGRATLGSAKTLLADLYLSRNESAKAEALLQEVVNSGVYSLNIPFTRNFEALGGPENSPESIFEAQYASVSLATGAQNDFSFQFAPIEDAPGGVQGLARNRPSDNSLIEGVELKNTLVQSFATNDLRRTATVKISTTIPIRTINAKFWIQGAANQGAANWPVYRYADVILMLAEAQQNQGKDAAALTEVNKLHAGGRTGLTPPTGLTGTALRDEIRRQRRLELCMEGKRWFDLMRWNALESTMTAHGRPLQKGTKGLLPIPQGEIEKNPSFKQNEGY